jgi:hypothetical protein
VKIGEVMKPPRLVLPALTPVRAAAQLLGAAGVRGAPVVGDDDEFLGVMSSDKPRHDGDIAARAMGDRSHPTVSPDQGLDFALDAMVSAGAGWVPVVEQGRVVGIVAMSEVISGYQHALRRSTRLLADIRGATALVEAPVAAASAFAGTTVATAPWPRGSFALSIDRHSQLIAPRPDTAIQAGDVVVVVVPAAAEADLRQRLDGTAAP